MRKLTGLILVVVAALGPAPALAQEVDAAALDRAIAAAALVRAGDHGAYVEARAAVLALGEEALPALAERGAGARFTAEEWRRALVAEACRVRLANPELAAQVDAPRGIDPATYRKFRRPEPFCQHDLARLGPDAVPLLLERLLWTLDARPFSKGDAGAKERRALALAALAVPGQHADARARHALLDAARDAALPPEWRQQAAVSAAQCGEAEALAPLAALLDDAKQAIEVREGCAWALGRIPTAAAADALLTRLPRTADERLAAALVVGIGILGDRWAWEARGGAAAETARAIRARCAAALVDALRTHPGAREAIGAGLAEVAWPESLAAVRALAASESEPREARAAAAAVLPALEISLARR